jgi:flagellin
MTVINTNTASINAQFNLNKVNQEMEKAMEQLSSGKRINSAADDAAGLSIATRMESQVRGLQQAISNAADGQNLAATAEGAMDEITNMLQRMRELALQASNDTMNSQDRENLDQEMGLLKQEIDRIVDTTAYNNIKLLDGSNSSTLQIGQNKGEELTFTIADMSTTSLGSSTSSIAVNASTSAVGQGVEASENVVNLTFNGNDSYGFKILFDATAAKEITIAPTAMVAGDAATIAKAINDQIAADTDVKGTAVAKASGTTVTLTSLDGSSIKVHDFTSAAAGSLTVNPVTDSSAA